MTKYLAVAKHPYYPEVEEFYDKEEASDWLNRRIQQISDPDGRHRGKFYLTIIDSEESHKVLY